MDGSEEVASGHTTTDLFTHTFYYGSESDSNRNYTVCYNPNELTTYWVAYPLNSAYRGSYPRNDAWAYIDSELVATENQANIVSSSYKNSASGGSNNYDRGHLLPSASRNYSQEMNEQTFYTVNIAPQNATFNQNTWNNLEAALQGLASSDNMFIVTGTMCAQANDGNDSFTPEKTYDNSGKEIPVPRYFYKVILKVDSENNPTSASAIGFWYTNEAHSGSYYDSAYVKSVDQIEQLTGMDFFVNLPDSVESAAEANSSWDTFQSF